MDYELIMQECVRMERIYEKYSSRFLEIYEEECQKVARREYGNSGKTLHRGYYCPSLIMDIVIGNVSRGRTPSKRIPGKGAEFEFGFNEENRLSIINRPYSYEVILYDGLYSLGLHGIGSSSQSAFLLMISECHYRDGYIESYSTAIFDRAKHKVNELSIERYKYSQSELIVDYLYFIKGLIEPVCRKEKYFFQIEKGIMTQYRIEEMTREKQNDGAIKCRWYKVHRKRGVRIEDGWKP